MVAVQVVRAVEYVERILLAEVLAEAAAAQEEDGQLAAAICLAVA